MAKLSKECFDRFQLFGEVVNCKEYSTKTITKLGASRVYCWKNTNKLLEKGFYGIKTGITENAGPCLAAAYKKELETGEIIVINNLKIFKYDFIIVILNCASMDYRWEECQKLIEIAIKKNEK